MRRLLALLALATATATAAPVYRCGAVYQQTPCENGRVVEATDPRTAAQRAEALRVAAAERRRAAEMARERRANDAAQKAEAAGPAASEPQAERHRGKRTVKTGPVKPFEPKPQRSRKR